jgi:hypothetical protein
MEYWIETYRSNQFDYENIEANHIDIDDIAHSLSMNCRFNGHCDKFYSVAEHSVNVSELVRPEWALAALLHDATEAYMPDVNKPLKLFWGLNFDIKKFEDRIMDHIYDELVIKHDETIHKEIKTYDLAILREEGNALFKRRDLWRFPNDIPYVDTVIRGLDPADAKAEFLEKYFYYLKIELTR